MTLTPEMMRVYASAPTDVQVYFTVEFAHPRFSAPARLVHGRYEPLLVQLEDGSSATFLPVPFEISLPGASAEGHQDLQISICNVGYELIRELDAAIEDPWTPVAVFFRIYLSTSTTPHQVLELKLLDVSATTETVTGVASRYDIVNRSFPTRKFRAADWPGLVR
jgi:hypothetical protein